MDLNESFDSNASLTDEIPEFNLPEDLSFERKFIITAGDIKSLIVLAHPKSGSPAYYSVSGEELSELLSLDLNGRSALYGNTVIREAKLYLNAPVHPFLLLLPYLYNKKPQQMEISQLFHDLQYECIQYVVGNPRAKKALAEAAEVKVVEDIHYVTYSQTKCYEWCQRRFARYLEGVKLEKAVPAALRNDEMGIRYYTFGIFSDFLPPSLASELKDFWKIEKPILESSIKTPTIKRPSTVKDKKKLAAEAAKQKKLKKASEGTQSLASFFGSVKK